MRLINDLKLNKSKVIDNIIYTKTDFTTDGFLYYNERHPHKQCWERYRDLLSSIKPRKLTRSDFWIKTIEMEYRGYIYQTIASNINEDIYEVIGIKENQTIERKEIEYYFKPGESMCDYLPYNLILKIVFLLYNWSDIWVYTNSCQTTLLLRKDCKFALRARKAFIGHRWKIDIRDSKLPIYLNGTYWAQRICLDDSYLLGGIPYNGGITQEIWVVEYPWIDYTTPIIKEVKYFNKQWCIFPLGSIGLTKVLSIANKRRDYHTHKRQTHAMNIRLNKREKNDSLTIYKRIHGKTLYTRKRFYTLVKI